MTWAFQRAALAAALLCAACDRIGLTGPPPAAPAEPLAPAASIDLRPLAGATYAEFVVQPGAETYASPALGLSETEQERFDAAMAAPAPAWVASGGGAEALVFTGCDEAGCETRRAVLAIDLSTGGAFLGVRDSAGADVLAPNPRLEALLRLTSPTRRWDDPAPPEPQAASLAPEAAPP